MGSFAYGVVRLNEPLYIKQWTQHGAELTLHSWWPALFADSKDHGIPVFWGWSPGIPASQLQSLLTQLPETSQWGSPTAHMQTEWTAFWSCHPLPRNKAEFAENTNKKWTKTIPDFKKPCPLSWWWDPTISSSVVPFSCIQSFPASGSFPMSQLFTSGGQRIGASTSELCVLCHSVVSHSLWPYGL